MVYCGKPSTGCQACRDKKTRCDKTLPSCTQCVRMKRECPGYRNQLDLMFRNESDAVIGKAKKRKSRAKPNSNIESATTLCSKIPFDDQRVPETQLTITSRRLSIDDPNVEELKTHLKKFTLNFADGYVGGMVLGPAPEYKLSANIDECAKSYFYTNSSKWLRTFDLLGSLCTQTKVDEHLLASMSAVGLATLSNSAHAPELLLRARKDYVTAIKLTNQALRSPTEAKKDSTLFAVLILSIFENITGTDSKSLSDWEKHINGAAALVRIRGDEQLESVAGQRMFFQVFASMILICIQRVIPLPAAMIELREKAATFMDQKQPAWKVAGHIIEFTIFRAEVRDCVLTEPRQIVERALELDRGFQNEEEQYRFTGEYKYKTIYTNSNPEEVWDGYYHEYDNHWAAQVWNGMRCCRIILNELMRDQLLVASSAQNPIFTDSEMEKYNTRAIEIMVQSQYEILASVPQHFESIAGRQATNLLEGSRGYFVLWPLYLVGVMDITSEPLRKWVMNRLTAIADDVGISQARVLVEHLKARKEIEVWEHKPTIRPKRDRSVFPSHFGVEELVEFEGDYRTGFETDFRI